MVSVWEPLAYEPPTTETFAELLPSETSWNIGLAAGNAAPLETDSEMPFTAMTAEVGGAVGRVGGGWAPGGGAPGASAACPPPPRHSTRNRRRRSTCRHPTRRCSRTG